MVCLLQFQHPLDLLQNPPSSKDKFKTMVKKKVLTYWELELHHDSDVLRSLHFFQSRFMFLTKPHPLWSSSGSSQYRVSMATIQAQMLTGRYRVGALTRHWIKGYKGNCRLSKECLDS